MQSSDFPKTKMSESILTMSPRDLNSQYINKVKLNFINKLINLAYHLFWKLHSNDRSDRRDHYDRSDSYGGRNDYGGRRDDRRDDRDHRRGNNSRDRHVADWSKPKPKNEAMERLE